MCVRALKGKWLELPTPNSANIQCMEGPDHALTLMSKVKVTRLSSSLLVRVCSMHANAIGFLVYD